MEQTPNHYPKFKDALVLVVLFLFLQLLASLFFEDLTSNLDIAIPETIALGFTNTIAVIIIISIGLQKSQRKFEQIFLVRSISLPLVMAIVITSLGLQIVLSEVDNIFCYFLPMPEILLEMYQKLFTDGVINALVLLVIIAPLTEETLCRGFIFQGFLKNYSITKAIVLSSLIFAIIHFNPWQFIGPFCIGLYLAFLYLRTQSIIPCILCHACINGAPFIPIYLFPVEIPGYNTFDVQNVFQPLWFNAVGIVMLVVGIALSYKLLPAR